MRQLVGNQIGSVLFCLLHIPGLPVCLLLAAIWCSIVAAIQRSSILSLAGAVAVRAVSLSSIQVSRLLAKIWMVQPRFCAVSQKIEAGGCAHLMGCS